MIDTLLTLYTQFQTFAKDNAVFSGLAGASLVGGLLYWAKNLPKAIYWRAHWATHHSIQVANDSEFYKHILEWIATKSNKWHIRELKLSDKLDSDEEANGFIIAPGMGGHWFWFNKWPYRISRDQPSETSNISSLKIREVLTISTPGFSRKRIYELINAVERKIYTYDTIPIKIWMKNWWMDLKNVTPRALSTVVMKGETTQGLTEDFQNYLDSKHWYQSHGIPYRHGYLFYGPPGTGKSSMAFALASHFKIPLYILNLGSISSDETLITAISDLPFKSILLIEDIDAAGKKRAIDDDDDDDDDWQPDEAQNSNQKKSKKSDSGGEEHKTISLSALLNCLDGIIAGEGRILIMTTNYVKKIDSALLRTGRVDKWVEFTNATPQMVADLFAKFFPAQKQLAEMIVKKGKREISPADVQKIIMENLKANPETVYKKLMESIE